MGCSQSVEGAAVNASGVACSHSVEGAAVSAGGEACLNHFDAADLEGYLLHAVENRDGRVVGALLASSPLAVRRQLTCAVLDRALTCLLDQPSGARDPPGAALDVLQTLLRAGVENASKSIVYAVVGLLRLVAVETLVAMTRVVAADNTRGAYHLRGCLLQALVHFRRIDLVETLVRSGTDPDAFWDERFDMRQLAGGTTGVDPRYARHNLLPPAAAAVFVAAAGKPSTLSRVLRDLIQYAALGLPACHQVAPLLCQIARAGYQPCATEWELLRLYYPRAAADYAETLARMQKSSKYALRNYLRKHARFNVLYTVSRLHQMPARLRNFLLLKDTGPCDIHSH